MQLLAVLATAASLSRSAAVALIFADSQIGPEEKGQVESKVSRFFRGPRKVDVVLTAGTSAVAVLLLLGGSGFAEGFGAVVLIAGTGLVFFRRKLGRLNGDALGACIVAIEIAVLATVLIFGASPATATGTAGLFQSVSG